MEENEVQSRFDLISSILKAEPVIDENLVEFGRLLKTEYLEYTKIDDALSDEAGNLLVLQELKRDLETFVRYKEIYKKNVIALGGGFSSGKSAFINSLFSTKEIKLATGINPVTAIPAYVVSGNSAEAFGLTSKGGMIKLGADLYRKMDHKFLKSFDFNLKDLLPSVVVRAQMPTEFEHICFIDTPGYNPADTDDGYTGADRNTSIEFIRQSQALLWLVGVDSTGTLTDSDVKFLSDVFKVDPNKKLYVICNKADLKSDEDMENILDEVVDVLEENDFPYEGVASYSTRKSESKFFRKKTLDEFFKDKNKQNTLQKKELLKRLKEAFVKHINADGEIIQKYSKNAQNLNRILLYFNSILDDVQTKFQKDVSEKRRAAIARGTKVSREESLEFESAEIIQKELSTFKSEAENKVNEYTQNKSRITDLASRMENTVLLIFKGIGDGEDESFVSLNAGAFMMGEEQGSRDAMPAHSVTLNPFAIKTTLVTQKDWVNVMGDKNPSFFKGDNLPVENVSYIDCALFCNKLSEKQKLTPCYQIKGDVVKCDFSANGYRLPTEAEWEFAARAGENNDSDFSLEDVAWYKENSSNSTQPVSMKKANSFGLYDMLGNVAEWCNDFYEPKYYSKDDDWDNPIGPISGEERVIRGGSYNSSERMCSITYRNCLDLLEHNKYTGFRIVTKGK